MLEKSLEAELLTLKATILKSETLYKTSILNHKEFSKVKVIYMKIKLLKISYATLLRKANQQKENRLPFTPKKANQLIEEGIIN
jgi:hypothetical protein